MARLAAEGVTLGYGGAPVCRGLSLRIPDGAVTAIVGPNGCGKTTLLRALARLIAPQAGRVTLDGTPIAALPTRQVARRLAMMPQSPLAPEGISVFDLAARGRTPHQSALGFWREEDEAAVARALSLTGTADLAAQRMEDLSGGQQRRVWLALTLAQDTDILLLDEPIAYLDPRHQLEVLALTRALNRDHGKTVVMVLHDLNLAARFADHLVAMRDGAVLAEGAPQAVLTPPTLRAAFDLDCVITACPVSAAPLINPKDPGP